MMRPDDIRASPGRSRWLSAALVIGIGVVGLYLATARGIGVTPDSVVYIDAARHLAAGDGFVSAKSCEPGVAPVTQFPPLYPLVLAGLAWFGLDPLEGARWLSLSLLAVNAALVALVVRHLVPASSAAPIAAAGFMVSAPTLSELHTAAWSEPLFLLFAIAGLFTLQLYLEQPRLRLLLASSAAAAAALLTRFLGAPLLLTGGLALLFNRRVDLKRRIRGATLYCLLAGLPFALNLLRNRHLTGVTIGNQKLVLHALRAGHLQALVAAVGSWLVPGSDRIEYVAGQDVLMAVVALAALIAVVFGGGAWHGGVRGETASPIRRPVVFEVFALVYVAFLLLSIAVSSWVTPIDTRLLSPVFVCAVIVIAQRVCLLNRFAGRGLRASLTAGTVALAAAYIVATGAIVVHLRTNGRGYTGTEWHFERIVAAIKELDEDIVIFSDNPPAVYFLTGRWACPLPTNGWYGVEIEAMLRERFVRGKVAVVRFGSLRRFPPRLPAATRQVDRWEIIENVDLQLIVGERNATLHRVLR